MPPRREETFNAALGSAVLRLRELSGWSQEGLARKARSQGLRWSRSTVAALEHGTKTLDVTELLLLAVTLDIGVLALLNSEEEVWLASDVSCTMEGIRAILTSFELGPDARLQIKSRAETPDGGEAWIELTARGEAEQKAARRLGISSLELVHAAFQLWQQSLAAERDDRVQRLLEDDMDLDYYLLDQESHALEQDSDATDDPPVLPHGRYLPEPVIRAIRGHVTRDLLEELRQKLLTERTLPSRKLRK